MSFHRYPPCKDNSLKGHKFPCIITPFTENANAINSQSQIKHPIYTLSCPSTFFPFNGGKSNAALRITVPSVLGTPPDAGLHHKAPTHGCTFHPTDSVTFRRSANRPVISLIWYFAFWPLSLKTPGAASTFSFLPEAGFALRFFGASLPADVMETGKRDVAFSFMFSHEYGDGVAGMTVSQITASESRTSVFGLSDDE